MNLIGVLVDKLSAGGWRGHILLLLLGACYALIFAPFNLFPIAFLILPVMVLVLDKAGSWRRAAAFGWFFGFGHFLAGVYWIGLSFLQQAQVPVILAPVAILALCAVLAIYFALTFGLARRFWSPGPERALVLVICWAAAEWARGYLFTGFPWNLAAHMWGGWDTMMQPVAVMGSYGYGLVSLFLAVSPVLLLEWQSKVARTIFGGAVVMTLVLLAWGADRLERAKVQYAEGVTLRLVQANIDQLTKWDTDKRGPNLQKYLGMSRASVAAGDAAPTHIIWPEAALTFLLDERPDVLRVVTGQLGPQVQLLTGAPRIERGAGPHIYTSLYHIAASGEVLATYDKHHLVPFGEYLPLRGLLEAIGLEKLTYGSSDYSAGPGPRTLTPEGLPPFSPLVCYEIIFPGQVIDTDHRPQWLLNITNDAWFGLSSGPYQHFQMARFRAVEEGVPVVRVASTGISAVIDPWGRVISQLPLAVEGIIDSKLPQPIDVFVAGSYQAARKYSLFILVVAFMLIVVLLRSDLRRVREE